MRVTQDFLATTEDELSAQTGDIVYKLFNENNDWVYVISEQSQEGFIPLMCVALLKEDSPDNHGGSAKEKTKPPSQGRHKTDDSMLAEEGSDASSGSRDLTSGIPVQNDDADDVAPPKPARGLPLDIPDVISVNGGVHHHHRHHHHHPHHHNHHRNQQQQQKPPQTHDSAAPGHKPKPTPSPTSPDHHRSGIQYISSKSGQNQRISLSSSVSGGGGDSGGVGLQRHQRNSTSSNNNAQKQTPLTSSQTSLASDPITEVRTFSRKPRGKLLVIFPFEAWDEGDMSVDRGEVVTALNTEDPLWTLVRKLNGQEGFVPAAFTCKYPDDLHGTVKAETDARNNQTGSQPPKKPNYHDVRDLVTLRKFNAQSADDISVEGGEQVFADLANQIEREWLWVYAPSTGKYGYIPRDNVVHADRTPLPKESYPPTFAQRPP